MCGFCEDYEIADLYETENVKVECWIDGDMANFAIYTDRGNGLSGIRIGACPVCGRYLKGSEGNGPLG